MALKNGNPEDKEEDGGKPEEAGKADEKDKKDERRIKHEIVKALCIPAPPFFNIDTYPCRPYFCGRIWLQQDLARVAC